jgi:magnesium transporter
MFSELLQPDLRLMLLEDDQYGLHEFCLALYPAVAAEVLHGLEPADVWRVLKACDVERQAEIFAFIDPPQQLELVDNVEREHLSKLIEVMSADDRVDLLGRMDEDHVESLLPLVAKAEREEIRKMLSYPEDCAGAIMTTEYASLPEDITVREALDRLRQQAPDSETIYYIYITDSNRALHGVITLRQLILARPGLRLADLMRRDVVAVKVSDDAEEVARQLALFDLIAIPVVDEETRLVGIITHDDVLDLVQEEANEDAYLQSAIEPLENDYLETPVVTMAKKRGVWLLLLAAVGFITAKVNEGFEGVSSRHDWLSWFLPLVLASGGNTGSQSATLVIRAITVDRSATRQKMRIASHELMTGFLLASAMSAFSFLAVMFLFGRNLQEAMVVAGTIGLVVTMGTLLGSALPLIFDRLGMDPALMSNPLISSLSDILGVVIYFSTAILILEMLL